MHLLPRENRSIDETVEAVDLAQTPADLVLLSFSDSDLLLATEAARRFDLGSVRVASLARLRHPLSVDLYAEQVVRHARAVVIRLLGGLDYWRYGAEQLHALAVRQGIRLAVVPGDGVADPRLADVSTVSARSLGLIWRAFGTAEIGPIAGVLRYALDGTEPQPQSETPARFGIAKSFEAGPDAPRAAIVYYRALRNAGNVEPLCALEGALAARGIATRSLYVAATKDEDCASFLESELLRYRPDVVLNTTAFSARRDDGSSPLDAPGAPVLQLVLANGDRAAWEASGAGLGATDLAMNVVMPELDGRLLTRTIGFKEERPADPQFEAALRQFRAAPERIAFVVDQALALIRLARRPNDGKKILLLLNDYPGAGGRAGHAVGLDGPESALVLIEALREAGFATCRPAADGTELMRFLEGSAQEAVLPLATYERLLALLPAPARDRLVGEHGPADLDPELRDDAYRFPVLTAGNLVIALQPLRGSREAHRAEFHDVGRTPRHAFLAFYWWVRHVFSADALVHLGAHGSLEWLPGKATALSQTCWPEIALGDLPVVYPFIVSDPGEAAQAKRRLSAVTVGHLTPPLMEAGLHGEAAALEPMLEEYSTAMALDPRRAARLAEQILAHAGRSGLLDELSGGREAAGEATLAALDAWLCDLKEMRIKDGLHIFGRAPDQAAAAALAEMAGEAAGADQGEIARRIAESPRNEIAGVVAALSGRRVAPGPAGAPARGRIDCLPTGRNLTTLDPRQSPTRTADLLGAAAAQEMLTRYLQEKGDWPRAIVLDAWGSMAIRSGGEEIAQAFALLGVRPVRETQSDRITGFEILPLAELGRPRIDVTLRISGLYRDLFPAQIALFGHAVTAIAERDEPEEDNPLRAAVKGRGPQERLLALARVFGPPPQAYGTGLEALVLAADQDDEPDVAAAFMRFSSHRYDGTGSPAEPDPVAFAERLVGADMLVRMHDLAEQDLLDAPDYALASGGLFAAARSLGSGAEAHHLDAVLPGRYRLRPLREELARIVRGRMTHPRWIEGQRRHGHRGAAELAQSVDSLFAFAATAGLISEHQFQAVYDAYLDDPSVDGFLREVNPKAHEAIEARLLQAIRRGYWRPRRNSVLARLAPSEPLELHE